MSYLVFAGQVMAYDAKSLKSYGSSAPAEEADLRDLRVGKPVSALPAQGYTDCARAGSKVGVQGWRDYARCPADAAGLHVRRFGYQEGSNEPALVNDAYDGTKVGDHPVLLTLLISDVRSVEGPRIDTDPAARLNRRRRAQLQLEIRRPG